jgi:ATP adenylyltransferase/5',5'''-P-1,P-4-tetraphosphate phosphorylase II
MTWEHRTLTHEGAALDLRLSKGSARDTMHALGLLRQQQLAAWPALEQGIAGLESIQYRSVLLEGTEFFLQHNPNRLASSSAKVDARSIANRPCFLCHANMPPEEKGVRFDDRFVLTFNPAPILDWHLVALDIEHTPQRIADRMRNFLELAARLGPDFVVIYNGPECGASAPDHMHFQAAVESRLPALANLDCVRLATLTSRSETTISTSRAYPIHFMSFRGSATNELLSILERTLKVLSELIPGNLEPMINIVGRFKNGLYDILLFPRSKHRPDSYFLEGERKRTISPAALDLAGIIVAPDARDFHDLESDELLAILREVTLNREAFSVVEQSLVKELA